MKNLINNMVFKLRTNFTMMDFGFLKLYGALFGAVIGAYFHEFVLENIIWIIWIFVVLLIRFLYLIFIDKTPQNVID